MNSAPGIIAELLMDTTPPLILEPHFRVWTAAYVMIEPDPHDVPVDAFGELCMHGGWLEAAMMLLPKDRAVRMHRYRGNRSGWCAVSKLEPPTVDRTSPDIQYGMEFFTKCSMLECAVLIVALKCAGRVKDEPASPAQSPEKQPDVQG